MNAMTDLKTDQTNAAWHARRLAATPRGVGVMSDFFIDRAKNAELWDIEGRRFIDFAGGIAVLNTGHVHPKVQAAIAAQLERFTHSCYQVVPYTEYVALAERINAIVPIDGPVKTAFFSTGAEAVENAVKIARSSTGRSGVIAFGGAFHGRSLFAVAIPARGLSRAVSVPLRLAGADAIRDGAAVQVRHRSLARGRHHFRAGAR